MIALARNDARVRAVLAAAWERDVEVVIPAVVLAETVRGPATDAPVNRVVKAIGSIASCDEPIGRLAGMLLGTTDSSSTLDALVVASAIGQGGGRLLTGDPVDLAMLARDHPEVRVVPL